MNTDLKVSVIIPTYKRGRKLVERAVNSIINQTYENVEIVLVDDNGREDLIEYRKTIQQMISELQCDNFIYVINEKNIGGALSRNEGIKRSSGSYITFLDDDDEYEEVKVEHQLKYMLENNLDVCISDLSIYNEKGKLVDYRDHKDLENFECEYLFKYHLTKQIVGTPTFMIKKEILEAVGYFNDAIMGHEFYLMSKIIQKNPVVGYLPESNIKAYRYDIEAISTGPNKIKGQKLIYDYKKKYFNILSKKQKRYIRCRHFAVMAVAYRRNKKYIFAILNLMIAILVDPILSIKEAIKFNERKVKK